jgi:GntR family transcriptional regulator
VLQITLDYTSGVPIYIQLKDAINTAIRTGAFHQGAQLPTVRQMAVELKINANTVSRAYMELEREGVIASQQGRGTFVTLSREIDHRKLAFLEQMVADLLRQAGELGFTGEDVAAVLETAKRTKRQSEYKEV